MIENGQDLDLGKVTVSCNGSESSIIDEEREVRLVTELTVSAKDENCKVTERDVYYGRLEISEHNEFIQSMIVEAITKLGAHPNEEAPEIIVKTKTIWQS
jgi:hypothetical protein